MNDHFYIEPRDVLILRGNKLFGEAGSYGESLVPPWPSVVAGALRSALLTHDDIDLAAFGRGAVDHPTIGTRDAPGEFAVLDFHLARTHEGGIETLHPIPADIDVIDQRDHHADEHQFELRRLTPRAPAPDIETSAPLTRLAVLCTDAQTKPAKGLWLTQQGFSDYLAGNLPGPDALIGAEQLWKLDPRVGVALDPATGGVREGALFSTEAIAFEPGVGFLAKVLGGDGLPRAGALRFGGDGRAAGYQQIEHTTSTPGLEQISQSGRCRLVLTGPAIFPSGWLPPGVEETADGYRFELGEVRGRLACAAVARAGVVSGWDLARGAPKAAWRSVPGGSVYWLEDLEATPQALGKLAIRGLWPDSGYDARRRAEGFNRFVFANY